MKGVEKAWALSHAQTLWHLSEMGNVASKSIRTNLKHAKGISGALWTICSCKNIYMSDIVCHRFTGTSSGQLCQVVFQVFLWLKAKSGRVQEGKMGLYQTVLRLWSDRVCSGDLHWWSYSMSCLHAWDKAVFWCIKIELVPLGEVVFSLF